MCGTKVHRTEAIQGNCRKCFNHLGSLCHRILWLLPRGVKLASVAVAPQRLGQPMQTICSLRFCVRNTHFLIFPWISFSRLSQSPGDLVSIHGHYGGMRWGATLFPLFLCGALLPYARASGYSCRPVQSAENQLRVRLLPPSLCREADRTMG